MKIIQKSTCTKLTILQQTALRKCCNLYNCPQYTIKFRFLKGEKNSKMWGRQNIKFLKQTDSPPNTLRHRDKRASGNLYIADGVWEGAKLHNKWRGSVLEVETARARFGCRWCALQWRAKEMGERWKQGRQLHVSDGWTQTSVNWMWTKLHDACLSFTL